MAIPEGHSTGSESWDGHALPTPLFRGPRLLNSGAAREIQAARVFSRIHPLETTMNSMKRLRYAIFGFVALSLLSFGNPAAAQTLKDQLVGSWTLVSNTEEYADGSKVVWGPDAKGSLMLDKNGQYSLQIGVGGAPSRPAIQLKTRLGSSLLILVPLLSATQTKAWFSKSQPLHFRPGMVLSRSAS